MKKTKEMMEGTDKRRKVTVTLRKERGMNGKETFTYENERGVLELWGGDPGCEHDEVEMPGGGVQCSKCGAWFCF